MGRGKTKCVGVVIALVISLSGPNAQGVSTDGLIAWWSFQGNANDASGNGHDGVVYDATLTEDRLGNPNSAYYFDGISDYINIGSGVKPPLPITVCSWIKLDSLAGTQLVFRNDWLDNSSYRYGVATAVWSSGQIGGWIFEGFSASWNRRNKVSDEAVATVGDWHHFAVVFNSINDIRLYWDATEVDGWYDGSGSGLSYSGNPGALGSYRESGSMFYFHGALDDVLVYGRALTNEEIHDLYGHPIIPAPSAVVLAVLGIGIINRLRRQRAL